MKGLVLSGAALAAAATSFAAFASPGDLVVLGKGSASGQKAHATAVVVKIGTATFKKITMEVTATPRQRVAAGYIGLCRRAGLPTSKPVQDKSGQTPLMVRVYLPPANFADDCGVSAYATLAKNGHVSIRIVGRD